MHLDGHPTYEEIVKKYNITGENDLTELIGFMQNIEQDYHDFFETHKIVLERLTKNDNPQKQGSINESLRILEKEIFQLLISIANTRKITRYHILEANRVRMQREHDLTDIYNNISDAQNQQNDLQSRVDKLTERLGIYANEREKIRKKLTVLREEECIPPETPNLTVWLEKYFDTELEKLKNRLQILQTYSSNVQMTSKENEKISAQILECKAKILATLMAYSDTTSSNPIVSLPIDEQQISLDCCSEELPTVLKLVRKIKVSDKTNYPDEEYDFIPAETVGEVYAVKKVVVKALEEEYKHHIFVGLKNLQIIELQSPEDCELALAKFSERMSEYENCDNKTAILLRRYKIGCAEADLNLSDLFKLRATIDSVKPTPNASVEISKKEPLYYPSALVSPYYSIRWSSDRKDKYFFRARGIKKTLLQKPSTNEKTPKYTFDLKELIGETYYLQVMPILDNLRQKYNQLLIKIKQLTSLLEKLELIEGSPEDITRAHILTYLESISESFLMCAEYMINTIIIRNRLDYLYGLIESAQSNLESQNENLKRREQALAKKTQLCEDINKGLNSGRILLGEEQESSKTEIFPSSTPEQHFESEFKRLQDTIKDFFKTLNSKIRPQKKKEVLAGILKCKVQFLAKVMAYSETIPEQQLVYCQLGEHKVSVKCLLEKLPAMLGLIEIINEEDKRNYSKTDYQFFPTESDGKVYVIRRTVVRELEKEYRYQIFNKLMGYQIVRLDNNRDSGLTYFDQSENQAQILLAKYCNVGKVENIHDPLSGLKVEKNTNPDAVIQMQHTPITDIIAEITKLLNQPELDER